MSATTEVVGMVRQFFGGDLKKALAWMQLPNPLLGGFSPRQMIADGREMRLLDFVKSALADNESPFPKSIQSGDEKK